MVRQSPARDAALLVAIDSCHVAGDLTDSFAAFCTATGRLDSFRHCIGLAHDTADITRASARVIGRHQLGARNLKALLHVCAKVCEEFSVEGARFIHQPGGSAARDACVRCAKACDDACALL